MICQIPGYVEGILCPQSLEDEVRLFIDEAIKAIKPSVFTNIYTVKFTPVYFQVGIPKGKQFYLVIISFWRMDGMKSLLSTGIVKDVRKIVSKIFSNCVFQSDSKIISARVKIRIHAFNFRKS